MVPNGWEVKSLDSVSKVIDCKHRTPKYVKEGVPLVSPGTIKWGALDLITPTKRVSTEEYSSLMDHCTVNVGDLVLSRNQSVGVASFVESEEPFVLGQDTVLVKPTEADSRFLFYNLQSVETQRTIFKLAGGSTFSRINLGDIRKLKAIYPPLPEQHKIAKILSTWDKAISTTERLIDNSKQQKKALMQQLLTGKKRLLDDSGKPFESEWTHGYLGDLCVFKGGSAFKEVYQGNSTGEIPFIKVSDMNLPRNGKFICEANNWVTKDIAKEMKAKGFPKGAVVFAKVGAALLLNRRRILTRETIIDNNMMAATPLDSATTEFLYQIMLAIDFAKFVQDGAVPSVNQSDLSKFKLTYPKRIEQEKIASVLANADQEIELLEQQLADFKQEKKALMQQMLTGKRRVKVDITEAASRYGYHSTNI